MIDKFKEILDKYSKAQYHHCALVIPDYPEIIMSQELKNLVWKIQETHHCEHLTIFLHDAITVNIETRRSEKNRLATTFLTAKPEKNVNTGRYETKFSLMYLGTHTNMCYPVSMISSKKIASNAMKEIMVQLLEDIVKAGLFNEKCQEKEHENAE